ncbi:stalk domain-containing protein [Marinicrinis sediminis]|uniref:Stalk domain-containing protein n=1 Tax=Marinicrinis sediminis TaxID=1652465 RepID=A0ABW5R5H4_9BACL
MKLRKMITVVCLLAVTTTTSVYASDVYEWFKAKEVKVSVNGSGLDSKGYLTEDGKTYLPLREITNTLQGIVVWDAQNQTVKINKPNVHISLLYVKDNKNLVPFGDVEKGKHEFVIFTQVDSLYTRVNAIKTVVEDIYGKNIYTYEHDIQNPKENFYVTTPSIQVDFKHIGKYTVKLYMKQDGNSSYSLVSERVIRSLAP